MIKNIALLAGGDSSEWQISLKSAAQIESIIDRTKYNVYKITVRNGEWYYTDNDDKRWDVDKNTFSIKTSLETIKLEYALILIHGTPGEDGRMQGYLDMMKVPYSSSGFVASVLTFDKSACKRALQDTGINMAKEILIGKGDTINKTEIINRLGLPLFVKPNASGSSFGVTKVKNENDLENAIHNALKESEYALLEEFIEGREISCGVMVACGKDYTFPITELKFETEFFDYDAKYQGKSQEVTPADLPADIVAKVNALTLTAYKKLGCRGVSRIDFIIKDKTPYLIEINTVPGMSAQSIIPQQSACMGMSMTELFNIIIKDTSK